MSILNIIVKTTSTSVAYATKNSLAKTLCRTILKTSTLNFPDTLVTTVDKFSKVKTIEEFIFTNIIMKSTKWPDRLLNRAVKMLNFHSIFMIQQ